MGVLGRGRKERRDYAQLFQTGNEEATKNEARRGPALEQQGRKPTVEAGLVLITPHGR